jgi:hypothetical protein
MTDIQDRLLRAEFFRFVFGERKGYVCIASESSVPGDFKQRFWQWPMQESELLKYVEQQYKISRNVWFGVNLLDQKARKKEYCIESNLLWADLDECDPDDLDPKPQMVIESSPKRYQAIWRVDEELDPYIAQDYSRRIYGRYRDNGVDSGWALTKLLRVPYTANLKYTDRPKVKLLRAIPELLPTELFDIAISAPTTEEDIELEKSIPKLLDAEEIIAKNSVHLKHKNFDSVWGYEPTEDDDWSRLLWRLMLICFESGLNKQETFTVANASAVNKYARDRKPLRYLWADVNRAAITSKKSTAGEHVLKMPELIPGDNYKFKKKSFIEEYTDWGKNATDACPQYHDLSAFILLSSMLAGSVKLETSFGTIRPNLWGLILGDSTLTRKSTAMRMATDIIDFVDRDILLATDGSAEGILSGLAGRPGRTSMFYRDEVVGFFREIANKQYLSGLPQTFTQLYDGGFMARRLRKELITVTDPVFIFFGGGIKDQFYSSVDIELIYSGFLPRFLIVLGETELSDLRRIGPPTEASIEQKQDIYSKLHKMYQDYSVIGDVEILGQPAKDFVSIDVELEPDAWTLVGEIEERMVVAAHGSPQQGLALPTFERLSRSMLKMAILVSAARQVPDGATITVTTEDVRRAASYIQIWGEYTIEVIQNSGQTIAQKIMERILHFITENPGTNRGTIMRTMNLDKRDMQIIEETLEARGQITVAVNGKSRIYSSL